MWGLEKVLTANYWELWEAVAPIAKFVEYAKMKSEDLKVRLAAGVNKICIYPAIMKTYDGIAQYATSRGVKSEAEMEMSTDKLEDDKTPSLLDYDSHDVFRESRPATDGRGMAMKGTFKIKGSVYYLPKSDTTVNGWVSSYLSQASRTFKVNCFGNVKYSGGVLLQVGAIDKPPSRYRVMTRYEGRKIH